MVGWWWFDWAGSGFVGAGRGFIGISGGSISMVVQFQLPHTTDPSQIHQIYSSLHYAHHNLSSFLSQLPHPPPQPSLPPPPAPENSVSSAVGNGIDIDDDDQMQFGDDELDEQNSKTTIERVEERMRDCFIQNKRSKRPLSPTFAAAAERQRSYEHELVRSSYGFDPKGTKLRALDLIYQFHG